MTRRKQRQDIQVGLFDQEMFKPVDLNETPPVEGLMELKKDVPPDDRNSWPRIALGSTKLCPHCGEAIESRPTGIVHCTRCWWWQGPVRGNL